MKTAQIAVLGLAVVSAAGAGWLAMNMTAQEPQVQVEAGPVVEQSSEQVLVASADIAMGGEITSQVAWVDWPAAAIQDGFIKQSVEPTALEEIVGTLVRSPILTGEPIRRAKLVGAGQSFMSSILPSGKREAASIDPYGVQWTVGIASSSWHCGMPSTQTSDYHQRFSQEAAEMCRRGGVC